MNETFNIMVVEDDAAAGKVICFELKSRGFGCRWFGNAEEALIFFTGNAVDLVLLDYSLPGMNGEEFYIKLLELNPFTPVVFMTALHSVEKAVQLLKMGAFSYLTKPLDTAKMHAAVKNALDKITLDKESLLLRESLTQDQPDDDSLHADYVFGSQQMRRILRLVRKVAGSSSNVLITGESGTGKDVTAKIIHYSSSRKTQPMIKVNLSALPPGLIEVELFGAVKGAYTGSAADRLGKFAEAHRGTLFLDEIGELSPDIQVKLLRVIQDREVTRLGSNKAVKLDIRLITATNKDLGQLVHGGTFREDLYYRLNVINIEMPPLRQRKEDIPSLIERFIRTFNRREGKAVKSLSREALDILMKYPFPGNIRQLENIIERAVVLTERDVLCMEDLPVFMLSDRQPDPSVTAVDFSLPLAERLNVVERDILEKTLKKHHYHQSNAALELGISEGCLRYKIRMLGIPKPGSGEKA